MSLFIVWVLIGIITITAFNVFNFNVHSLVSTFFRRFWMVVIVLLCYPTFVLLSALFEMADWWAGDKYFEKAMEDFLDATIFSFYDDMRDTWNGH